MLSVTRILLLGGILVVGDAEFNSSLWDSVKSSDEQERQSCPSPTVCRGAFTACQSQNCARGQVCCMDSDNKVSCCVTAAQPPAAPWCLPGVGAVNCRGVCPCGGGETCCTPRGTQQACCITNGLTKSCPAAVDCSNEPACYSQSCTGVNMCCIDTVRRRSCCRQSVP